MKMKAFIILFLLLLSVTPALAVATDTETSKAYYYLAKQEIEKMLSGERPLSYERAVYLIENAYWDGRIEYTLFRKVIDNNISTIHDIIASSNTSLNQIKRESFWDDLRVYRNEDREYTPKLVSNWAIYNFMTDTAVYFKNGVLIHHLPLQYSFNDPKGTIDWRNTQVINLLHTGHGNCFALASLFKIFSERLNSEANICTAPGHVYIRHRDAKGTKYNVEISSRKFPGTGTMETLTYTTADAVKNNISLRELNLKQSVGLCLIYLAKGYEYKFKAKGEAFILQCAETAIKYDSLNLNAMLLKAEALETNLHAKNKTFAQLQLDVDFKEYQKMIGNLYRLGYREMPLELKNFLARAWSRDSIISLIPGGHTPKTFDHLGVKYDRYASLSWGAFDEEMEDKPVEKYGRTLFDTKNLKIAGFTKEDVLYNDYNFDPVLFADNVDPLAHQFPWQSPYAAFDNSPIWKNDPTGASGEIVIDKQSKIAVVSMNIYMYGAQASTALAKSTARDIQNIYNAAHATVKIGNETYKVQFDVQGSFLGNGGNAMAEASIAGRIFNNTDIRNNYYRVESQASQNGSESFSTLLGNDGMFNYSEISGIGSTTEGHEAGHGLGLKHNNPSVWQSRIIGEPDLMDNRNDIVSDKYKKGYALPDGTLDIGKRKVSQRNVNGIFTPSVIGSLEKNGKAAVGVATDTYYLPNATPINKP